MTSAKQREVAASSLRKLCSGCEKRVWLAHPEIANEKFRYRHELRDALRVQLGFRCLYCLKIFCLKCGRLHFRPTRLRREGQKPKTIWLGPLPRHVRRILAGQR